MKISHLYISADGSNQCLKYCFNTTIFLIFIITIGSTVYSQTDKVFVNLADNRIRNVSSNSDGKYTIKGFIEEIFWNSDVPAGIIWTKDENIYQKFPHHLQGLSIREALDLFVREKPEYAWEEINNEVVNIFPKNGYSIMDSRIPEFKIDTEYPWKMDEYLIQTIEFQTYLSENNLIDRVPDPENKYGFLFIGPIGRTNPRAKRSINLRNATVREILNEIIIIKASGIWSYREYDLTSNRKFYRMYRLEL